MSASAHRRTNSGPPAGGSPAAALPDSVRDAEHLEDLLSEPTPGVIDTLLFVGDRYEARVTLGGEHSILLLLPRAPEWREGQALQLAFPPELVSVWPA